MKFGDGGGVGGMNERLLSVLTFVSGAGAELDEQEQQQQPHVHIEARGDGRC